MACWDPADLVRYNVAFLGRRSVVEFCVLGGLAVRSARGPLAIGGQKPRTVLAVLLLHANATVPVAQLVDAVWPGGAPASAAKNLQTYVWTLRRTLTEPGDIEPRIATRPTGYRLLLGDGELDLLEFERLAEEGRRLRPTDAAAAGERLRAALALWRGPLLPDLADVPALAAEAARVDELRHVTVEERVEADLALGRHTDLVAELSSLVAALPTRERLRGQQIRTLHRCGRRADALAAYQDLCDRLGGEPGPELRRLHQAVLRSDATDQPARVRTVPAQLPADTAEFTGRVEHLRQLDTADARVITVVGSSGIGKTSLAVHWAHRVRDRFPDGQLYVNLRGRTAPLPAAIAIAQFLRALGVAPEQVPVAEDEAAGLYRSLLADRRMLILLDDARDAEQVRPLLPGNPACQVLVTSRNRLAGLVARDGARPLALDVLPPDEAVVLLRRLVGPSRAGEPVAALAPACGFLPLAMRIAAAHLATRPNLRITDYVAALGGPDRFAALRVEGDPESAVTVAFDQSYRTLDEDTRRLFRLLSVAPGPDVSAAAATVLAGSPAGVLLERLVAGHMVAEPGVARYAMHDLLRLYAQQQASADPESADARQRL
ncbi:MAG TPA: BTAD domain-containing putative transcriptional regulator, partial [Pseudonocardiaceae bacterium]|nr:BTAD domain-containing putative transcriptional regulator [Pseudonocardiaceae bacterium]